MHPINDINLEISLVKRESESLLKNANIPIAIPKGLTESLVQTFHELRRGKTAEGKSLDSPSTVMSTAEAVSVNFAAATQAYYYADGKVEARHVVENLIGSAIKDNPDDIKKLKHYFDNVIGKRKDPQWQNYYQARKHLN